MTSYLNVYNSSVIDLMYFYSFMYIYLYVYMYWMRMCGCTYNLQCILHNWWICEQKFWDSSRLLSLPVEDVLHVPPLTLFDIPMYCTFYDVYYALSRTHSPFFGAKWQLAALVAISGPKKSWFSGPAPSNCPRNVFAPHQNHNNPCHIINRFINSYPQPSPIKPL